MKLEDMSDEFKEEMGIWWFSDHPDYPLVTPKKKHAEKFAELAERATGVPATIRQVPLAKDDKEVMVGALALAMTEKLHRDL